MGPCYLSIECSPTAPIHQCRKIRRRCYQPISSPRNGIWTFHASWLETFRDVDSLWLFLVWLSLIVDLVESLLCASSAFNFEGFPIWSYHLYHCLGHFEMVTRWHFAVVTHSTTWSFWVTLSCFWVFSYRTKFLLGHFRSYEIAWGKYMHCSALAWLVHLSP